MKYRVEETIDQSDYSTFRPQYRFCFIWWYFYTKSGKNEDKFDHLVNAKKWLKNRLKKTQYLIHKFEQGDTQDV